MVSQDIMPVDEQDQWIGAVANQGLFDDDE